MVFFYMLAKCRHKYPLPNVKMAKLQAEIKQYGNDWKGNSDPN